MGKDTITVVNGKVQKDRNKLLIPLAALVLAVSAVTGLVGVADAAGTTSGSGSTTHSMMHGTPPAAVGKVTAINGDSITLSSMKGTTTMTYTVDATNATITKSSAPVAPTSGSTTGTRPAPTTITVSQVAVGDTLVVQGTVSGTNITATKIEDGMFGGFGGRGGMRGPGGMGVQGTVTAVNGSTLTVTGKNGTTYTVNAGNSTVSKLETISVSDVAVGDSVGVQGTVSGNTVTAKSIMDGMPKMGSATSGS
jgi:Domain of unknown function (DUF5666)